MNTELNYTYKELPWCERRNIAKHVYTFFIHNNYGGVYMPMCEWQKFIFKIVRDMTWTYKRCNEMNGVEEERVLHGGDVNTRSIFDIIYKDMKHFKRSDEKRSKRFEYELIIEEWNTEGFTYPSQ